MTHTFETIESTTAIAVPTPFARYRRFPLDGALLLFDRDTGTNVLCDGAETTHLRQVAPRAIQFGITNLCNLACTFCSRDTAAASAWSADEAFHFLADLAAMGVLEVAFGGGEPWAFRGFSDLVKRLHAETPLAVSFTTNGLALTPKRLCDIAACVGQCRLSIYDDNDWRQTITILATSGVRFGVNFLVTPARLSDLDTTVFELAALGCRDILLLSYNGADAGLHLDAAQTRNLAARVRLLAMALGNRCQLKLDVCWGERLESVPRLFTKSDCGAGREFVVITSDKRLMPCSFHHLSLPVGTADDVMNTWREQAENLRVPSTLPGCARAADFGLSIRRLAVI